MYTATIAIGLCITRSRAAGGYATAPTVFIISNLELHQREILPDVADSVLASPEHPGLQGHATAPL